MNAQEYINYLASPTGRFALGLAAKLLADPDPEIEDAVLVEQVEALGFPKWAALRIFKQCTMRYAPLICRTCNKQFKPKSVFTIDRPYCGACVRGPLSEEKKLKLTANRLAMRAEVKGKIKRRPCQCCGDNRDLQMHHPDYSRPLYVIWLCVRCHAKEHKKLRASA